MARKASLRRRRTSRAPLQAGALLLALVSGGAGAAQEPGRAGAEGAATTPNAFLARGTPTFVLGTAGDERADAAIAAQVRFLRGFAFADAPVVADTSIRSGEGAAAWPPRPVLYGGPHVHSLLAALELPFRLEAGELQLGGETFRGDSYQLITVVPARAATAVSPGHPEFLLYAGTGTPGVAEINALTHGTEAFVIGDAFGRLAGGSWDRDASGTPRAAWSPQRGRRLAWRTRVHDYAGADGGVRAAARLHWPVIVPEGDGEEDAVAACVRGLERAAEALGIAEPCDVEIYVYPDLGSIAALTGKRGAGHAVVEARALHVVQFEAAALESLLAHEGAHVLGYAAWGAAGSALLGEGLAVWAAGRYGDFSLAEWRTAYAGQRPDVHALLGRAFRQAPEHQSYPFGGLLVETLVEEVGLDALREHLYPATSDSWSAACESAGSDALTLEAALHERLRAKP